MWGHAMWGHVDGRLDAYCEGLLSDRETRAVKEHLARCPRCERLREETERGLALIGAVPAVRLPEHEGERIRTALAGLPLPGRAQALRERGDRWRGLLPVAAAAGCLVVAYAVHLGRSPVLRLEPAPFSPLPPFEATAVSLQRQASEGTLRLDVSSGSVPVVRRWVRESTGLGAGLAAERPAEDAGRFELQGAKGVVVAGASAVAIAYRIDDRPAVLLTASASDVPGRPGSWMPWGKAVRRRVDPATGVKVLTWTNSGQVYALVSELPGLAVESCFVCHTDAGRRELIRGTALRSPPSGQ